MIISVKDLTPESIQEAITQAVSSGQLESEKAIYYKVDEENLTVEVNNSTVNEEDMIVKPGAIKLPEMYTHSSTKSSMAEDPIYSQALETHWGF